MSLQFARLETEFSKALLSLKDQEAGAFVTFTGRVRRFNHDKEVSFLFYEAHESLAKALFITLEAEAKARFSLLKVFALHRLSRVEIGQDAVVISVAARHRKEAFLGARFLIDELKQKLPIWKKEVYKDGSHSFGKEDCGCVEKREDHDLL